MYTSGILSRSSDQHPAYSARKMQNSADVCLQESVVFPYTSHQKSDFLELWPCQPRADTGGGHCLGLVFIRAFMSLARQFISATRDSQTLVWRRFYTKHTALDVGVEARTLACNTDVLTIILPSPPSVTQWAQTSTLSRHQYTAPGSIMPVGSGHHFYRVSIPGSFLPATYWGQATIFI